MLKKVRENYILDYLKTNKTVSVKFLSHELNVTPETIRRDLDDLEAQKKLQRIHGGAVSTVINIVETNFLFRETINRTEKQEIAQKALCFIYENDFIALDVSTTNTEIAKILVNEYDKLSILTNSLTIAQILSANQEFNVFIPSGKLKNSELCIVGPAAMEYISQFHIDTFFMSASGVSLTAGITDNGFDEYEIKKMMFKRALNTYAVIDSSKFGAISRLKVDDFENIDGIITDSKIDNAFISDFSNQGIQLYYI